MRIVIVLLLLGALGALGALLFVRLERDSSGAAPGPRAVEPRTAAASPGTVSVDEPPSAPDETAAVREGAQRAAAPPPSEAESPVSPDAAEALVALRGFVRWSDDETPLGDFEFVLRGPGEVVATRTDASGYFETGRNVAPGVLLVLHRPSPAGGPYRERLTLVDDRIPVHGDPGETVNVELRVRRPEALLTVRVVHRDGRPEPSASVELALAREIRPGEMRHLAVADRTDEEGAARFALVDLERVRTIELVAREVGALPEGRSPLVSAPTKLEVSLHEALLQAPVTLVLDAAGRLLIRVVDETGGPVAGKKVLAVLPDSDVGIEVDAIPETDEQGEVLVEGLPPGEVALWILDTPVESAVRVDVAPGETREVELVLVGGGPRLAVSGLVVDEDGEPLPGVSLFVEFGPREGPGLANASFRSDAAGRFEIDAEPCDELTIRADRDLHGDEFDPAFHVLPFGTRDVLFRRTRAYAVNEIAFEITDSVSDERCVGAVVMTYRAPRQEIYAFHLADEGLASPRCSSHPATTLVVAAPGYRRTTLALSDLLSQEPRDGLRRVALEKGLLRRLHVAGDDPGGEARPVRGARVLEGRLLLGETDANGDFQVDLDLAPEHGLTIEAEGFRPVSWHQSDHLPDLEAAWIWLERH